MAKKNDILYRLLWEGKSSWQMFGALVGSFLGIFLLLTSLQLYQDVKQVLGGSGSEEDRYLMINKRVNLFNTLGVSAAFNEEEIEALRNKPYINEVGIFTPNQYRVSASSKLIGFYTELFFEAVPAQFLDYEGSDWHWQKGDQEIPILLSRDYLALYNFGFAPSQGLPQFTPQTIRRVSFDLSIKGRNQTESFSGRIVGFSDRINSVLVPQEFMDYANATFGGREKAKPSRLILDCENVLEPELEKYISDQGYELSRGRFIGSQVSKIMGLVLGVISLFGIVILTLSLLVFMLNFQLLIAQSARDIRYLLHQGFPILTIRQTLHQRLIWMYGSVLLSAMVVVFLLRLGLVRSLGKQEIHLSANLHWLVWLAAFFCGAVLFYVNYENIRKQVVKLFAED